MTALAINPSTEKLSSNLNSPKFLNTSNKKYPLTDLLPYSLKHKYHSKLIDGIKEYKLLLIAAEQSLSNFLEGILCNFDSLVGENSCQIRATLISVLAQKDNFDINLILKTIRSIIKKIESDDFISKIKHDERCKLENFLEENHLVIKVGLQEIFLISSYILTKVRVILPPNPSKRIVRNEITDTKKVKEISPVGSTFARDLVKKLRNFVSTTSVAFVQDIADTLCLPESIQNMVSEDFCLNHDKFGRLKCLPTFWYTLVLIQYSLLIEVPLVFIISQLASDKNDELINEEIFCFEVIDGQYQLVPNEVFSSLNRPALVILGSCCRKLKDFPKDIDSWKKEILEHNPKDLLLAYSASHRQYPDESKDKILSSINCPSFRYYKSKANEWGCSLNNPSLFFLVHAYCEKIHNIDKLFKLNDNKCLKLFA